MAQTLKNPPAVQETQLWSLDREDPLRKGMATQSSICAWRIPWQRSLMGYSLWGRKECYRPNMLAECLFWIIMGRQSDKSMWKNTIWDKWPRLFKSVSIKEQEGSREYSKAAHLDSGSSREVTAAVTCETWLGARFLFPSSEGCLGHMGSFVGHVLVSHQRQDFLSVTVTLQRCRSLCLSLRAEC